MRKFCSVASHILAGFFLYGISLLAFTSQLSLIEKTSMMIVFGLPVVAALFIGLALAGFCNWRRDVGIVFLSTAAMSAFVVITVACMLMSESLEGLLPLDIFNSFNAHFTGFTFIALYAVLGALLLKRPCRI